jgi:hypothetical protein
VSVTPCNEVNITDTSVVSVSVVETTEQVVVGQPVTETVVIDGSQEVNVTSTSVESVAVVHVTEQIAVSEPITETVVVNQGVLGEQGIQGPPGPLQWIDYASHWDTEPTEVSAGVLSYTWLGVTRYRNVPDPYVASSDAFYSDAGLSNLIIARGQ